jgi:hypothetical protein
VASIRDADRKLLWGRSGDECAFPGCVQALTTTTASGPQGRALVLGMEAHIVAEEDDGPRGNPSMPIPERNAYPNLILLCPTHHMLIDKDHGIHFSVDQLLEMKRMHEQKVAQSRSARPATQNATERRTVRLLELASAIRGRLVARWVGVGLSATAAQELADDATVGSADRIRPKLPEAGLAVLEGDFGSGKSVVASRWYAEALAAAVENDQAPVPVHLEAQSVTGPLIDAVREAAGGIGTPSTVGLRLVLDGLDEPGSWRAARLLDEARALAHTWPNCQILATARPGLNINHEELIEQPPMSDKETAALVKRVGGRNTILWDESEAVRKTLRLPLFALIAALHSQAPRDIPRSRGAFLSTLAESALNRTERPAGVVRQALMRLAGLTTAANGAVPAAELGDEDVIRTALETRLLVRRGSALAFSLPVVEQYFAGQAILSSGPGQIDLHNMDLLDRLRYPLVLAITTGGWEQTNALLRTLVAEHPGLAAWIVTAAMPDSSYPVVAEPPSELECGRRIHQALDAWIQAMAAVGQRFGLTGDHGQVRTIGVSLHNKRLTAALSHERSSQLEAARLPVGFNLFTGKTPDGSEWAPSRYGPVAADFPVWPWKWALDWVSQPLERIFAATPLPLSEGSPMVAEWQWALARALSGQSGSAAHKPLGANRVRAVVEGLLSATDADIFRLSPKLLTTRQELTTLLTAIESGNVVAEDGLLHRPYPTPDVALHASGHVSKLYSNEALRRLVEDVYTNALLIFHELVDTWFPKLKPTLGLACLLPVVSVGR